jgi:lysophospholipase L1-like esterase
MTAKKQLLFSIITAIGALLLIEFTLRLTGTGDPLYDNYEPYAGYEKSPPFYIENPVNKAEIINNPLYKDLHQITFRRTKPENTCRIALTGGSNVNYLAEDDLANWIKGDKILPEKLHLEIINAGMPGYGSRRVKRILVEILQYDPDMVFIYCGHNEFLDLLVSQRVARPQGSFEYFRKNVLYKLNSYIALKNLYRKLRKPSIKMNREEIKDTYLKNISDIEKNESITFKELSEKVYDQFEQNLIQMVRLAKRNNSYVILSTTPSNDFVSPVYSFYTAGLSTTEIAKIKLLEKQGDEILGERLYFLNDSGWFNSQLFIHKTKEKTFPYILRVFHDRFKLSPFASELTENIKPYNIQGTEKTIWLNALDKYEQALKINDKIAMIQYKAGLIHYLTGNKDKALYHFHQANLYDGYPYRSTERINNIIRDVARREKVDYLLDFEEFIRQNAPDSIIGWESLYDHCHLQLENKILLLKKIEERIYKHCKNLCT